MSQSSSCPRCRQPLAIESASGLCDACSKALETSRPQATPPSNDGTRKVAPGSNAATHTAGFDFDHPTATWTGPARTRTPPDGYDLLRHLGCGGMGDVWLAREHHAERIVAIKFLRPSGSPATGDRFLSEVRALGRLDHPNVVRILSVEMDRGEPFYSMEYGAGGTIADRLKAEGPFDPDDAAKICVQLADALATVHEAQTLHRDIKPSNVVFSADGTPKLSDFGLAKLLDAHDELTRTTQAIGTPAFMPPEQISRKFGAYTPATDVYGLGATLYSMLTGKAPFEGDSNEDVISKVQTNVPVRPRVLRPNLPMPLEAVVMKCLEKKAADRYASAEEFAKDLSRCLERKPPVAPQQTRLRRVRNWCHRHRVAIATSVLAAGAAIALTFALAPVEEAERIRSELQKGKSVTLIGAKGPPKHFRWMHGATAFGASDTNEGACEIDPNDIAMLELLDDPGIDHYRIRLEIRQIQSRFRIINEEDKPAAFTVDCGVYFSDSVTPAGNGSVHLFQSVRFRDADSTRPKDPQQLLQPVSLAASHLIVVPNEPARANGFTWSSVEFLPSKKRPGLWRTIEVEIRPESIQAIWIDRDAKTGEEVRHALPWNPAKSPAFRYAKGGEWTNENLAPRPAIAFPAWRPRMPLGLFTNGTAIAVRNVTITPVSP